MHTPPFNAGLTPTLSLTVAETTTEVPAGNIESFKLTLTPWGFSAELVFWLLDETDSGGGVEDTLFADFVGADLIEASFAVEAVKNTLNVSSPPEAVAVTGYVLEKSLEESLTATNGRHRRYSIRVADPAAALWKQHHPCQLYTDACVQDILDEHKGALIALTSDWETLDVIHPVLFLALGVDPNGASFYDLLVDYVRHNLGHFVHDHTNGGYSLLAAKPEPGESADLDRESVASVRTHFPATPRYTVSVLNAFAEAPGNEAITNEQMVEGLRRDVLTRSAVTAVFTDRQALETSRFVLPGGTLSVALKGWPAVDIRPGAQLTLSDGLWTSGYQHSDTTYRVTRLVIEARAVAGELDTTYRQTEATFTTEMSLVLEDSEEATQRLPSHTTPTYTASVEGYVVSSVGEDEQESWEVYTDEDTSVDQYRVRIPLWDEQEVVVDLHPDRLTGALYIPAVKDQRVLLSFTFNTARIECFLDWRPGAKVPQDGQGNRVVFGLTETDRTTLTHDYVDDLPVFTLLREKDTDTGRIEVAEGRMVFRIEEEA